MSTLGAVFFALSMLALLIQVGYKIIYPDIAPHGITMLTTLVVFLGSLNLLAISIVGAYVGTILEETKRRPRFLRDSIIRNGRVHMSQADGHDLPAFTPPVSPSQQLAGAAGPKGDAAGQGGRYLPPQASAASPAKSAPAKALR
jgi:hypothetical protein